MGGLQAMSARAASNASSRRARMGARPRSLDPQGGSRPRNAHSPPGGTRAAGASSPNASPSISASSASRSASRSTAAAPDVHRAAWAERAGLARRTRSGRCRPTCRRPPRGPGRYPGARDQIVPARGDSRNRRNPRQGLLPRISDVHGEVCRTDGCAIRRQGLSARQRTSCTAGRRDISTNRSGSRCAPARGHRRSVHREHDARGDPCAGDAIRAFSIMT